MRMYPREFPSGRRKKPKRQAERRVYEALAGSDRRGFCYYEWRQGYEHIELDFAVWVNGLGRFALQVKGGRYLLIDGEWYLKTREGNKHDRGLARWTKPSWRRWICTTTSKSWLQTALQPVRHSGVDVSGHGARPGHRAVGQAHGSVRDLGRRQPVG